MLAITWLEPVTTGGAKDNNISFQKTNDILLILFLKKNELGVRVGRTQAWPFYVIFFTLKKISPNSFTL
jgi:type III secretory pathway component EscT